MSSIATHILIWLGVFIAVFVALQLVVALAYVAVKVLFPDRTAALTRLRSLNERSIHLAAKAADKLPVLFGWLLAVAFVLLVLIYS